MRTPRPRRLLPKLAVPLVAGWLAAGWLALGCRGESDRPNILLITLDTTRRDHLGFYGYGIPSSPNLDRLAADSVVYTNAYAVSSWTLPTHASIFTGKFPSSHGANYDPAGPLRLSEAIEGQPEFYPLIRARPIAEDEVTLAEILSDHGYETGGIIAGPWMKRVFGLDKGFRHYDDGGVTVLNGRPAEDVTRAAIEFVDRHADDPFFLFLNYYDPHEPRVDTQRNKPFHDVRPVVPPGVDPRTLDQVAQNRILYDAEIFYMDREIGRLIEHLEQKRLYQDTWIFVLADHGELIGDPVLGEKGITGHGDSLTEAEIRIPFLVKEPGANARKGTDGNPVQQVDVLPTVLERLRLALPPGVQGRPIGASRPFLFAELTKLPLMNLPQGRPEPRDWRQLGDWRVLIEGPLKLGWSSNGTHFLVDLEHDPLERTNLFGRSPEVDERLARDLEAFVRGLPKPGPTGEVRQPDRSEIEALKRLGYTGNR